MSARGVLDLWQIAYWEVRGQETEQETDQKKDQIGRNGDKRAEKIARSMLRNIIAESRISSKLGRLLQDRIILRNAEGGTLLDFDGVGPEPRIKRLVKSDQRYHFRNYSTNPGDPGTSSAKNNIRTVLDLNHIEGMFMYVEEKQNGEPGNGGLDDDAGTELSPAVTAWLCILHDIVRWAKNSSVVSFGDIPTAAFIKVVHEVRSDDPPGINTIKLKWPAPNWGGFLLHNVFRMRWEEFLVRMRKIPNDAEPKNPNDAESPFRGCVHPRLLVCGWVVCALETFFTLSVKARTKTLGDAQPDLVEDIVKKCRNIKPEERDKCSILSLVENDVVDAVFKFYQYALEQGMGFDGGQIVRPLRQIAYMQDWIEQKLPLFLTPLYVPKSGPIDPCSSPLHEIFLEQKDAVAAEAANALLCYWTENAAFIQAEIDTEIYTQLVGNDANKSDRERDERRKAAVAAIAALHTLGISAALDPARKPKRARKPRGGGKG